MQTPPHTPPTNHERVLRLQPNKRRGSRGNDASPYGTRLKTAQNSKPPTHERGSVPFAFLFEEAKRNLGYPDLLPDEVTSSYHNVVLQHKDILFEEKAVRILQLDEDGPRYYVRASMHFDNIHAHCTARTFNQAFMTARKEFVTRFENSPEPVKQRCIELARAKNRIV